ncbi:hypothetical protein CDD83_6719 [Cordyceps sp. RAO-2017]|nr:hypothetical protein CDD83_6719 [Cordyceps sp. RAO-2017]
MFLSTITFRFLTAAQVMSLHRRHISEALPAQPAMLKSAVSSPLNPGNYRQTDRFQLAGVLAERIILNHPFQDGNKRTALYAVDMFLKINGHQLQKSGAAKDEHYNESVAKAHIRVVTIEWTAEQLGKYYESIAQPLTNVETDMKLY